MAICINNALFQSATENVGLYNALSVTSMMIFMCCIGRKLITFNDLPKLSFTDQEENSKYVDFMSQKMCRLPISSSITLTYSMLPP